MVTRFSSRCSDMKEEGQPPVGGGPGGPGASRGQPSLLISLTLTGNDNFLHTGLCVCRVSEETGRRGSILPLPPEPSGAQRGAVGVGGSSSNHRWGGLLLLPPNTPQHLPAPAWASGETLVPPRRLGGPMVNTQGLQSAQYGSKSLLQLQ